MFKVAPDGTETVLYSFCAQDNCADGAHPSWGLIADTSGNFYGTAVSGGTGSYCPENGCGAVFRFAPDGTESVLYSFCAQANCADGAGPNGPLLLRSGYLYGTTFGGGANGHCFGNGGMCGTVFKVQTRYGSETVYTILQVPKCADGASPRPA